MKTEQDVRTRNMSVGFLGKKRGMTHIFSVNGELIPVTVIEAGPCTVVQKKTEEKDGYNAIQLGFLEKKANRVTKPLTGHFKKHKSPPFYKLKEYKVTGEEIDNYESGKAILVQDILKSGDVIDVSSRSKGRGFAGVIKRWGFQGGPGSHGSMFNRRPGSIGASATPSRVMKGKKLPGRFGGKRVTVKNLQVVAIKPEENCLIVKGGVPGSVNDVVEINKVND
jgi:large subunit ribosomal protein L3